MEMILVPWPEVQDYMDMEGFEEHSSLANDEFTLNKYGSSAYWIEQEWKEQVDEVQFALEELRGLDKNDIY